MTSPKYAINTQNQYKALTKRYPPIGRLPPSNERKVVNKDTPTIITGEKRIRKGPKIKVSPIKKGEMSPASQHTSGNNPSKIKAIPAYAI